MVVVEDYEADNGHDQDILTADDLVSKDLPDIGTWGKKEHAADVSCGKAFTSDRNRQLMGQKFTEIFSDRRGHTNLAENRIDLTFDKPIHQTLYPVPFVMQTSYKKELQQMEDLGIIRKSNSPYVHQIRVRPLDIHKTAFVTMSQHYELQRMPFRMVKSRMPMLRAV